MPKRHSLLVGALAVWSWAAVGRGEDLRIGKITVETLDIYSPEEAAKGWIYRGANALHIPTRARIIHKFLLFKEGDRYDPAVLAETERNLRKLSFLKLAWVTAGEPHDGVVDVKVVTQDTWTTELGGNAGSKGGATTYSLSLKERNLFGTGRQIELERKSGFERTETALEYSDPYLFGPYFRSHILFSDNSDGQEKEIEVERPFFATTTAWAMDVHLNDRTLSEHVYRNGVVDAIFRARLRTLKAEYGRGLDATLDRAHRVSAGFESVDDRFEQLPDRPRDELPDARDFRNIFGTYAFVENDFLKLNFVHRDLRYEDFNLGRQLSVRAGFSPEVLGVENTTAFADVRAARGLRLGERSFIIGSTAIASRFDGGPRHTIFSIEANYVLKFETRFKQTLVAHASYDHGWNLDRDFQFFADGANGLRAYRLHAFEGNKRFVLNVEQRFFLGREILQLITPALAVFVDIGGAVPEERGWSFSDLKSDAGISLRLGVPRSSRFNVLRIDAAYAFDEDPLGRKGFLFSVTSAQSF